MVAIVECTCLEITASIQKELVELWRSEPLGKFMQERIILTTDKSIKNPISASNARDKLGQEGANSKTETIHNHILGTFYRTALVYRFLLQF